MIWKLAYHNDMPVQTHGLLCINLCNSFNNHTATAPKLCRLSYHKILYLFLNCVYAIFEKFRITNDHLINGR